MTLPADPSALRRQVKLGLLREARNRGLLSEAQFLQLAQQLRKE